MWITLLYILIKGITTKKSKKVHYVADEFS